MAEIFFVLVIGLAVVTSISWLVDGYKKELKNRQKQKDLAPLLGVTLPNKKDKKDEQLDCQIERCSLDCCVCCRARGSGYPCLNSRAECYLVSASAWAGFSFTRPTILESRQIVMSEKRYKVPIPVRPEDLYASREKVEPAGAFVVSGGVVDEVRLSAVVYRNVMSRKSLTVHHLQRRLNELGFTSAYLDKDGWFDEGTKSAIRLFQEANGLPPTGMVDADTMTKIFDGDPNVLVVLD